MSLVSSLIHIIVGQLSSILKYCNFEEYSICISLWSPMVLPGEPLVLLCTPMLIMRRTNKSHEAVPTIVKVGH